MGQINGMLKEHGEWIYRGLLLVLLAANLWLQKNFVTKLDYDADRAAQAKATESVKEAIVQIQTTIVLMKEENRVNDRQEKALLDHETRIRTLEKGK